MSFISGRHRASLGRGRNRAGTKDIASHDEEAGEEAVITAKVMAEKDTQESMMVLRERLRIMQMMVDDCAAMFEQRKIKKWKEARRRLRDQEAEYGLDWNVIGCVLVTSLCYVIRVFRQTELSDTCLEDPPPLS